MKIQKLSGSRPPFDLLEHIFILGLLLFQVFPLQLFILGLQLDIASSLLAELVMAVVCLSGKP